MPGKNFFDSLRDSINQIVTGNDAVEGVGSGKEQQRQSAKNEIESAIIVLVTEVMRLSGNYTSATEKILYDFLEKNFGKAAIPKRKKSVNDHLFVGPQAFTKMACEQIKTLATNESKFEVIKLLYDIATLDDFINAKEEEVIRKIAKYLAISGVEFRSIQDKYVSPNNPFIILEMEETVSIVEVKSAYRKMVLKYHPDKRIDKIDTDEANKKFREIKRAYETILKKLKS